MLVSIFCDTRGRVTSPKRGLATSAYKECYMRCWLLKEHEDTDFDRVYDRPVNGLYTTL